MQSRVLVLLVFFLFSASVIYGQRAQDDDSNAFQAGDTTKIDVLNQHILRLRETDPVRATKLCLEAIALSQQLGYAKGVGRATGSLGWIYFRQGDFVKALSYSIEALKISEKAGDYAEMARCLNNMAAVYHEEKQDNLSLLQLKKALLASQKIGDTRTMTRTLNNTALLYLQAWQNFDSVKHYATLALALSEKDKDEYNGAFSNRTMGDLYQAKGDSKVALTYYFRSLALSDAISNALKTETWNRVAEAYISQRKYQDALVILTKNIEVTRKFGYREELARCYKLLSDLHQQEGNPTLALDYLQRYSDLHDSTYNEQNGMRLAALQSQFDLDLKQAQIELLTKDKEISQNQIRGQKIQLYATVGGMLGVLVIAGLLFYVNRRVSTANVLLEKQKYELAIKNQEVELKSNELELQANQLVLLNATKDKLFSIIGHDFRSPLNSLKGILALMENRNLNQQQFTSMAGALKANLDSVSTTLDNLLQWSLAQIQGIQTNPIRIDIKALVGEHITLFTELAKAKNITLENKIGDNLYAVSDENHTRLVLRNLINNAIKFSLPGGVVTISNQVERPFVKILVSDTGVGIEPQQLRSFQLKEKVESREGTNREKGIGIGLMLCQEFVENNGGELSVASEVGKGTVFAFTLKAA